MATKSPLHGATRGFLVIMLLLITGCVTNPYTNRSQLIMVTLGEEKMMGLQAFNNVVQEGLAQNAIVTDQRIVGPITRIADRIIDAALHSHYSEVARQFDWEIVVLNSQAANAMCAPGGKIIVMTGILPIAKNAAGLAAVLGHEVTHALARHGAERMSQGLVADAALTGIGTALQSELSPQGLNLAMQAMGMVTDVAILKPFSREHESEADYIGLSLAAQAGYDPTEAIRVWERMSAASAAQPPEFLSTHPSHGTRIQQLEQWMPEALSIYNSVPHAASAAGATATALAGRIALAEIGDGGAGGSVPAGHRIIGKWYNGLGNGQYIRYQFTDVGAYAYSNPLKMITGTFTVQGDQLTLRPSDGAAESYTFTFECIGTGSFSEYLNLKTNATRLETPFVRDPTDPGQRCK